MVTKTFQRTKYFAYVKLGSRQKKLRRYKRPTGRHNKSRQKWRSRPPMVEIGYKNKCAGRGLINGKTPVLVHNLNDLGKLGKDSIAIIGKIGNKKKIEMAKYALEKKIEVYNLDAGKFMSKINGGKKA